MRAIIGLIIIMLLSVFGIALLVTLAAELYDRRAKPYLQKHNIAFNHATCDKHVYKLVGISYDHFDQDLIWRCKNCGKEKTIRVEMSKKDCDMINDALSVVIIQREKNPPS